MSNSLFSCSPPRGALSLFFFFSASQEMEESLDAEPRLFVGQVRAEREGRREGGEREESKEKAFTLLSRCGGKKKGEKRGRKEAPGTRWNLPLALFFPWVINT